MTLKTKFCIYVSALIALIVLAIGGMMAASEAQSLKAELEDRQRQMIRNLAHV